MSPVTYNLVMDERTGEVVALGRNGRTYSMDDIVKAEKAAKAGDADAMATMTALDHTGMSMEDLMHDCPLCREERDRTGESPEPIFSWTAGIDPPIEELALAAERRLGREPNWWMGRRKQRRRARHRGRR